MLVCLQNQRENRLVASVFPVGQEAREGREHGEGLE